MSFYFLRNSLTINGKSVASYSMDINGLIQINGLIIVYIYGYTAEEMEQLPTNNVYAFSANGDQTWQITEPYQPPNQTVSYADISLRKIDGKEAVVAGTTQGTEYIINIEDGSVSPIKGQRPW